ncbi:MAG: ExsB family transcriptional regulator, partial [Proteobacteria bacterium]|nr:ExsB family transcriptional regulator [Pseudomonadota bacterium]
MEEVLGNVDSFQNMAILHRDRATGMRNNMREFGRQIEIRSWESTDARTATPMRIDYETLFYLADRITKEVQGVVSTTYNITKKPPSTMEAV